MRIPSHPNEILDLICVSDLSTWWASRSCRFGQGDQNVNVSSVYYRHSVVNGAQPIAVFLAELLDKLADRDPSLAPFAYYFRRSGIGGGGGTGRLWPPDVLSGLAQKTIVSEIQDWMDGLPDSARGECPPGYMHDVH
jgi:hypothetical protein